MPCRPASLQKPRQARILERQPSAPQPAHPSLPKLMEPYSQLLAHRLHHLTRKKCIRVDQDQPLSTKEWRIARLSKGAARTEISIKLPAEKINSQLVGIRLVNLSISSMEYTKDRMSQNSNWRCMVLLAQLTRT